MMCDGAEKAEGEVLLMVPFKENQVIYMKARVALVHL